MCSQAEAIEKNVLNGMYNPVLGGSRAVVRQSTIGATILDLVTFNTTVASRGELFQFWTMFISMAMQIGTLVLTVISIAKPEAADNELLHSILLLELVVQGVEFLWYAATSVLAGCYGWSIPVWYRYTDWAVTTPTMLISLYWFVFWQADPNCNGFNELWTDDGRIALFSTMIALNMIMLIIGFAYEFSKPAGASNGCFDCLSSVSDSIKYVLDSVMGLCTRWTGLWLGFLPFFGAFAPILALAINNFTDWGIIAVSLTFASWALYGANAIYFPANTASDEAIAWKNGLYNLLDIVSKNVIGIVISIVTLTYADSSGASVNATTNCTRTLQINSGNKSITA